MKRALAFLALLCAVPAPAAEPRMSWLDNGTIRVGANLDLGGSITWLSKSGETSNVINSHDWGREVQMSFYSGPVPFLSGDKRPRPNWEGLGWNPIQAGDDFGHRSRVLEQTNDGRRLYVKCIPMQWPLENVPGECTMESWLELEGATVKARARLVNARADHTLYPARMQELPAVYTNGAFHRIVTYSGAQPFTGDALREVAPKPPPAWTHWLATENWSASVDAKGWGLGVWTPATCEVGGGFNGSPRDGGPLDPECGYLAPQRAELIDHDIDYSYEFELTLGTVEEIRARALKRTGERKPPGWSFGPGRAGWVYRRATDRGWRAENGLDVQWEQDDPNLESPPVFWRAEEASTLVLEAAFTTKDKTAQVFWSSVEQPGFTSPRVLNFPIVGDGELRTYRVRLADSPAYRGGLVKLRLDPGDHAGGSARFKSIRLEK